MIQPIATIAGRQCSYFATAELDEVIRHEWHIARSKLIETEYLFMTEAGAHELVKIAGRGLENPPDHLTLRAYLGMHVVVLPSLPDNTFIIGSLRFEQYAYTCIPTYLRD